MTSDLTLTIEARGPAAPEHLVLTARFRNGGDAEVRLLGTFTPLPVFFAVDLTRSDGTPLLLPGAGKIDLWPPDVTYVPLGPGESFAVDLDVGAILPAPLEPDTYTVAVTYHNQYGEDCFQGVLHSEPITVRVDP
jgi:hypothetical protein